MQERNYTARASVPTFVLMVPSSCFSGFFSQEINEQTILPVNLLPSAEFDFWSSAHTGQWGTDVCLKWVSPHRWGLKGKVVQADASGIMTQGKGHAGWISHSFNFTDFKQLQNWQNTKPFLWNKVWHPQETIIFWQGRSFDRWFRKWSFFDMTMTRKHQLSGLKTDLEEYFSLCIL